MKVSVVIGSRNRPETLCRCLESVLKQDYPDFEVLVLDDASDEVDLCQVIRERFDDPRLRCLRSDVQLGVAGGRNRLAAAAKGEVICFIDDDAYFENNSAIGEFVNVFLSDEKVGIVAVKVINHRQNKTELLVPIPRIWRLLKKGLLDRPQFVSYYVGTCHAIRREVFQKCGMYSDELMFGEEELDLSYRVVAAGYRIYYEPSIIVHHYPGSSVLAKGKQGEARELYHHVKNRFYLAYRYLPARYIPFYLSIWLARYFLQATKRKALGSFLAGICEGICQLSKQKRTPIDQEAVLYLRKHYGRLWY